MFRINIPIPPPNESNALLARSAAAATHTFNHPDADPQSERTHPAGYLATALMHLSDQLVDDSAGFANEALPATTLDCVDEFNKAKNQRCPHCHSPYIESRAWHEPCPTCGQPAHSAEPRTTTLSLTTHLTPPNTLTASPTATKPNRPPTRLTRSWSSNQTATCRQTFSRCSDTTKKY